MTEAVWVIGAGARTPLGRSLPTSAAAVRGGIAHLDTHPSSFDAEGRRLNVARATWLPEYVGGEARFVNLARNAAKEALACVRQIERKGLRLRVLVGLPEVRPGRPSGLEDALARAFENDEIWGPHTDEVVAIGVGHAASLVAIERAMEALRNDEVDLCLAGGVDSYLPPATLEWLAANERSSGRHRPWGFTPGEAAGFCLLASERWLSSRTIQAPLAVLSACSAIEPAPMHSGKVCLGLGLSQAFDGALAPLRSGTDRVSTLTGDLNGEPHRADELGFALSRVSDLVEVEDEVLAPAAFWGDVGAASGALFMGLSFVAAKLSDPDPRATLVWASSEGSCRAAAVLQARSLARKEVAA